MHISLRAVERAMKGKQREREERSVKNLVDVGRDSKEKKYTRKTNESEKKRLRIKGEKN